MTIRPSKASIKAAYIAELQTRYDFYRRPGSRTLDHACKACDAALSGSITIQGAPWTTALAAHGIKVDSNTAKTLAALPVE